MEKDCKEMYNPYPPSRTQVFNSKGPWQYFNTSTSVPNTEYYKTTVGDIYVNDNSNFPKTFTPKEHTLSVNSPYKETTIITNDPNKLKEEEKEDFVRKIMVNPSFSEANTSYVNKKKEKVNHPSHYNNKGKETIKVLEDYLSKEEYAGFLKGNILKYIHRYETKNGLEDLNKAKWYLEELIRITTLEKKTNEIR